MRAASKTTGKNKAIDLRLVRKWLREAGKIALARHNSLNAVSKTDGTLVTNVDYQIETLLYERISQRYPDHQILAEEGRRQRNGRDYLWTIDPIDGTRSYASGLPVWVISLGILRQGNPYMGIFFMPTTGDIYWGTEEGAFFNNKPISSPKTLDLQNPLAFIAVPSNAHCLYEISFPRLRSLGSTVAHLAYVARGAALAALTRQIYIWDIAPVLPLLKATGIGLVYLSGKEFEVHQLLDGSPSPEPLIAAPLNLIEEIRNLIHGKSDTEQDQRG